MAKTPAHWRLLEFLLPRVTRLYARLWHGYRYDVPAVPLPRGGALVIANHPCHADAAFLTAGCQRWIHFLQAREEYDIPLLRPFFRILGCIPVRRERPDIGALRLALNRLRQGAVVGVFPEGELTPADGTLHAGKAGAALLALRSGVPVIPAFISGTAPARGTVVDWLRPAPAVRVRVGAPIDLSAFRNQPITHRLLCRVTELLMQEIAELRPMNLSRERQRRLYQSVADASGSVVN